MTKPIAEATIAGDFTPGTHLSEFGRSYEFGRANGVPFAGPARPAARPVPTKKKKGGKR